jgi:hypothetical protein
MKTNPKGAALGGIIIALRKAEGEGLASRKQKCKECGKSPCECEDEEDDLEESVAKPSVPVTGHN